MNTCYNCKFSKLSKWNDLECKLNGEYIEDEFQEKNCWTEEEK